MKSKVLTMRVGYDTIAYCYQLQEKAGRAAKGKPMSTIVSDTLDAIVLGTIRMQGIEEIEDENQAIQALAPFADKVPMFDGVEPEWKQPTELVMSPSPMPAAIREALGIKATPTAAGKETPGQTERGETAEPARAIETEKQYVHTPSNTVYSSPDVLPSVEQRLEELAEAEELMDEQALKKIVDLGVVERVSPDAEPAVVPKCPWEGANMIVFLHDQVSTVYEEANKIDELYGIAVRVVLARFPYEEWNSDRVINLAKKTYKDYKEWKEKYGNETK